MRILKRSGELVKLDISNIHKQTVPACKNLNNVSSEALELSANISFTDGMKSTDIQDALIKAALSKVDIDAPDWAYVAARLELYDLYHCIKRTYNKIKSGDVHKLVQFSDYLEKNKHLLSYNYSVFDLDILNKAIKPKNDKLFTYLGITTLRSRYLLRDNKEVLELPQHMFMSVACFLAQSEDKPTEKAVEFYSVMSNLEALVATPTLANGRKLAGNCYSCAVGSVPDDLSGIFDAYKEVALGSKFGSGWGMDWSRVRANGGTILGKEGAAGGTVPFLKIANGVSTAVNQLNVRNGAINTTMESWHKDIIDFLDLKKNGGEDKRRAKELFISVSLSDEFMSRVESSANWTLFDPYDTPELTELYGEDFRTKYIGYECDFIANPGSFTNTPITINAKDLYKKIQRMYSDTGMPFIFFKDNVNNVHTNKELGIIRSSNLCHEIALPTDENTTALCNLASINLARCSTDKDLKRVVPVVMRMLDNVIDHSTYVIPKSEDNQKRTRAVGLGTAGEAECIANKQIVYGSEEHKIEVERIYSTIAEVSDEASISLGDERGTWSVSSPYRNAYRRAIAPTSSVGLILGTTASHEPVYAKVWTEENKMGAFKLTAPNITTDNVAYYVSPYDISQIDMVELTAIRQKYVDQAISHNLYFTPETTTGKMVFDTIIGAWKLGVKTLYYYRSKSLENKEDVKTNKIVCEGCEN